MLPTLWQQFGGGITNGCIVQVFRKPQFIILTNRVNERDVVLLGCCFCTAMLSCLKCLPRFIHAPDTEEDESIFIQI